jgi:hypothetical protein
MGKKRLLLIVVIAFLCLAAFKTLTPSVDASKTCLLGYKAFCSFTPISTAILVSAAVSLFFAARRIVLGGTPK